VKRQNISGFEFKLFGYTVEIVTVYHFPVCIAVWKCAKLVKRYEIA
jgi:hypothetical protein